MKLKLLFPLFLLISFITFSQTIAQPSDYQLCDTEGNGTVAFDLTSKNNEILNGLNPSAYSITYHLTQSDADQTINPLPNPYFNTSNPQTIYVSVLEVSTGNLELTTFDLVVLEFALQVFSQDVIVCDEGEIDGISTFDLTLFDFEFTQGNPSFTIAYYESYQDALNNVNPIATPSAYTNITAYSQTLYPRITDSNTGCFYVNQNTALFLNVDNQADITAPAPLIECDTDDDGFFTFNLGSKVSEILGTNNPNLFFVSFHETIEDAQNFTNALPNNYTNIIQSMQTIYVRVSNVSGECYQLTELDLVVNLDCVPASSVIVDLCTDNPNDTQIFDLTSQETNIVNGQNVLDYTFTYYESEIDAQNEINSILDPTAYLVSGNSVEVIVRVDDNQSTDFAIVEIFFNLSLNPQINFNGPYTVCSGTEIVLTPFINGGSQQYSFLWNTGAIDPEIVVFEGGTYTVSITDLVTGCMANASVDVNEGETPVTVTPSDITNCGPDPVFDLTSVIPELLNGVDAALFEITFHNSYNDAFSGANIITNENAYTSINVTETIYVRVLTPNGNCVVIEDFNLISGSCPIEINCDAEPVNTTYCYELNDATQYTYESVDGSQLQVFFNAGQVEVDWDELYVIDSDGITNLNPENTSYGNNGDLTGLSFVSTGNRITVYIDSDDIYSCADQNYTPIDYDVSCVDTSAVPNCDAILTSPLNLDQDVDENTDLSWSPATVIVNGYKISLGITPGGTEVLDHLDVGDVLTYDLGTLDFSITYYATITPYNDNGDAFDCNEESFTTRANPNQIVTCENGVVNTTYCYENNDDTEFGFQSSDGSPLTIFFNAGSTEVDFDEVSIIDSDGSILNPNLPYGNDGDFTGLNYTSSGSTITVRYSTDGSVSCANGNSCCTAEFDFDVFCSSSVGIINVNAFVDANANNSFDANEVNFSNGYFTYEVNGNVNTVNSSTGNFQILSANETDVYNITFNLYEESAACYDTVISVFDNVSVAAGSSINVDFPIVEEQSCEDLAVYLINYSAPPRPGFTHTNHLVLENLGFTTISSGTVEFTFDPLLIYNNVFSVNPNYTITTTTTGFTVDFVNLQPGDVEYISISLTCPASVALGEIVTNTADYLTDSTDLVVGNNYSTLSELVVGSWDPNDKMEAHGPKIVYDDFAISDEYLYYTIRFQNLGTAEAIFIRIDDVLSDLLDETTFQMLRSSHDYVVTRSENNLEWFFDNINLPAEQDDELGSQGFVYFRVKPKVGYSVGDIISNTAAIYFDFNAPVITNRFDSEFIEDALSVSEFEITNFEIYPNPANDVITVKLNEGTQNIDVSLGIYDIQGKLILSRSLSEIQTDLNISNFQSGMYFVKLNTGHKEWIKKLIIE
ncbi:T9SS type A sorting domain-containing protein [uncultured Psychroserpens sp.]|uniref:T9SS type A sorting domain-containing protein n=1 Tax=uncultured Psychroserpens sp. TaxID=255436 RepID=UPI00261A3930|nr:T9SS type A sorting domain-containing protein [uncultured Psychroserpens sp.]